MTPMATHSSTTPPPTRALMIVEDESGLQVQMRWAMDDAFVVHIAKDRAEALETMARCRPHLVVLDLGLPPDADGATEGLATLEEIVERHPGTKVIVASGNADRANAMRAVRPGPTTSSPSRSISTN